MTKLSIIVPVYNEIETLPQVIDRLVALDVASEIIVVDNVSTDGTRDWVRGLSDRPGFQVVLQEVNLGKGNSVRTGLALATGEYVVAQDADLEYDPEEILDLLAVAEQGHDAVFGSRLLGHRPDVPWHHGLGRDALNFLFGVLYGSKLTDIATCYKLMRTTVAQSLTLVSVGFDLDYEIPCRLCRAGVAIVERPISYHPRTIEEGKKLRWTDGMRALKAILRFRWGSAA